MNFKENKVLESMYFNGTWRKYALNKCSRFKTERGLGYFEYNNHLMINGYMYIYIEFIHSDINRI